MDFASSSLLTYLFTTHVTSFRTGSMTPEVSFSHHFAENLFDISIKLQICFQDFMQEFLHESAGFYQGPKAGR